MSSRKSIGKKINSFSMDLLMSYFTILVAPSIAIVLIYFASSNLLLDIQTEKMLTLLNTTSLQVDRALIEAGNLGMYLSNMDKLVELGEKNKKKEAPFFEYYSFTKILPDYRAFNSVIDDIYIFFNEGDWLICNSAVVPADNRAYNSIGPLGMEKFNEIEHRFTGKYYNQTVIYEKSESGITKMMVAQSFPHGSYDNLQGTIVITIDETIIMKELEKNLIEDSGVTMIVDSLGNIQKIISGNNHPLTIEDIPMEAILSNNSGNIKIRGEKYVISKVKDMIFHHTYITLVPRQVVLAQVGYIKFLIIALCVCSIALGSGVCIVKWRKRRNVLLAYSNYYDEFGRVQEERKLGFWEGINSLISSVSDMQTTIRLQKDHMKTRVIRKLLMGDYVVFEELVEDMKEVEIEIEGKEYCAISIKFHRSLPQGTEYWNEIRLEIQSQIRERITLPHLFCEISFDTIGMIIPIKDEEAVNKIKVVLDQFEQHMKIEKQWEVYCGIGRVYSCLLLAGKSYEEAEEVTAYLKYHKIRMSMTKEELPKEGQSFFFPMETELLLVKTIKQANQVELRDIFRVLEYENLVFRKLSLTMINHLIQLVKATTIRSLSEEEDDYKNCITRILKAESLEEIKEALLRVMPCIEIIKKDHETHEAAEKKKILSALLQENYCNPEVNIAQIAELAKISESRLYKEFKCIFGVSFSEYLENIRIQKACELLQKKESVKEVAQMVGYGSDLSFRRAFKRVMGLAPSYYANGLQEEKE